MLDNNWVETTWYGQIGRTRLAVLREGEVVHTDEIPDDPSGVRAFAAATEWASVHFPGVVFNWKHDTYERWKQTGEGSSSS